MILGTRGSDLALVQTHNVASRLSGLHRGLTIKEQIIKTTGDNRLDVSLSTLGSLDKGLFTKELEEALLRGEVHAAVHSLKDLPTDQPPGLIIGAILERADMADCLASKYKGGWRGLPAEAVVGTSSLRRKNQLLLLRPELRVVEIRGNIPTRLRKLKEDAGMHAIVLARAAIDRLGHQVVPDGIHTSVIEEMLPAPGQGAIAVECRANDFKTLQWLAPLHHEPTARCVTAERDLLRSLGGGCHLPLGALAVIENGEIHLRAALFEREGVRWLAK